MFSLLNPTPHPKEKNNDAQQVMWVQIDRPKTILSIYE